MRRAVSLGLVGIAIFYSISGNCMFRRSSHSRSKESLDLNSPTLRRSSFITSSTASLVSLIAEQNLLLDIDFQTHPLEMKVWCDFRFSDGVYDGFVYGGYPAERLSVKPMTIVYSEEDFTDLVVKDSSKRDMLSWKAREILSKYFQRRSLVFAVREMENEGYQYVLEMSLNNEDGTLAIPETVNLKLKIGREGSLLNLETDLPVARQVNFELKREEPLVDPEALEPGTLKTAYSCHVTFESH